MSYNVANIQNEDSSSYSITSKYKSNSKDKDTEKLKKSKQIVSEREGDYYCTYIVDDKGGKTLISKIPASLVEKQKKLQKSMESDETKSCDYNELKNIPATFQCKQKMYMESNHKKDLQGMINILKQGLGISCNTNKSCFY